MSLPATLYRQTIVENNQEYKGIAVIGMSGRFPGANNIQQFWENLKNGVESITTFSDEELLQRGVPQDVLNNPDYVKASPLLEGYDQFDPFFFGISPKDAQAMDPQQRIFLETLWEALENAGYVGDSLQRNTGVYAGIEFNQYYQDYLSKNPDFLETCDDMQLLFSNEKDYLSSRISYMLNLKGPSVTVQTACSTSLVAVHMACESIMNRECDMAIAGGVSIVLPQNLGYFYSKGGVVSPDGHCRAFDEKANGTVTSSGVGIVVLKHVEDAIADQDHIWAVIRGTSINNDGSTKVDYAAPSVAGQSEVIMKAIAIAQTHPETIGYVEAHGTGTSLGDPIEVEALIKAYRSLTKKTGYCAIGSVKTNVGHLKTAAGVTGLIKTILTLKNEQIPPSLNFVNPNPEIDFENSPFRVNAKLKDWKKGATPRRAAVSSFGIGGTNAHAILEEAPTPAQRKESSLTSVLLPIAAKTKTSLHKTCEKLADFLTENEEVNLVDVAHTLQIGRESFEVRKAIVCQNREEAIQWLRNPESDESLQTAENGSDVSVEQVRSLVTPFLKNKLSDVVLESLRQTIGGQEQFQSGSAHFHKVLAKIWMTGGELNWEAIQGNAGGQKIPLPTYSFDHQRYWVEPKNNAPSAGGDLLNSSAYQAIWNYSQEAASTDVNPEESTVLLFQDKNGLGDKIRELLRQEGGEVTVLHSKDEQAANESAAGEVLFKRPDIGEEYIAPKNKTEEDIAMLWTILFGFQDIGVNDNFFRLGGHSVLALHLLAKVNKMFNLELSVKELFVKPTIGKIAETVETALWHLDGLGEVQEAEEPKTKNAKELTDIAHATIELLTELRTQQVQLRLNGTELSWNAKSGELSDELKQKIMDKQAELLWMLKKISPKTADTEPVVGELPLFPNHNWLFKRNKGLFHWNVSEFFEFDSHFDLELVKQVMDYIVRHHDSLRMHLVKKDGEYVQYFESPETMGTYFLEVDMSHVPDEDLHDEFLKRNTAYQEGFVVEQGPLLKVVYYDLGKERSGRLLLLFHHLVYDDFSIRIFFEDFIVAYQQLMNKQEIDIPKTSTLKDVSKSVRRYAKFACKRDLNYWGSLPWEKVKSIPIDYPEKLGEDDADAEKVLKGFTLTLTKEETIQLKTKFPSLDGNKIYQVVVTALLVAFKKWLGTSVLYFATIDNGRNFTFDDTVNFSRTLGCFIDYVPVLVDSLDKEDEFEILAEVAKQLEASPKEPKSFSALKYLNTDKKVREVMDPIPDVDFSINYNPTETIATSGESPFRPALEPIGENESSKGVSVSMFCRFWYVDGELNLDWCYRDILSDETMRTVAEDTMQVVRNFANS